MQYMQSMQYMQMKATKGPGRPVVPGRRRPVVPGRRRPVVPGRS